MSSPLPDFGEFPEPPPAQPFTFATGLTPSPSLNNVPPAGPQATTGAPQGGGEDIWINTEEAKAAVREMRTIVDDLTSINMDVYVDRVLPATKDLISTNYVNNCGIAVEEARIYFSAWQDQLRVAILSLEQQVKAHELTEEQNRQNLTRS